MKDLDIQNKIELAVFIEKQYFAWKNSWGKLYNELTEKERQRRRQIADENEHIVKMTIEEENIHNQGITRICQSFKKANKICQNAQSQAKRCNRNIEDTIGMIVIKRIHKVYIRRKGLSQIQRQEQFIKLHEKIQNFRRSKDGTISKGVQITALKKILCMREICEACWDEILNEVEIYKAISKSKMKNKPFEKMYYQCFVPRLRQIHRNRQTRNNPWNFNIQKKETEQTLSSCK